MYILNRIPRSFSNNSATPMAAPTLLPPVRNSRCIVEACWAVGLCFWHKEKVSERNMEGSEKERSSGGKKGKGKYGYVYEQMAHCLDPKSRRFMEGRKILCKQRSWYFSSGHCQEGRKVLTAYSLQPWTWWKHCVGSRTLCCPSLFGADTAAGKLL